MTSKLLERYLEHGFVHLQGVFDEGQIDAAIRAVENLPNWIRRQRLDRNIQRIQPLQSCEAIEDTNWIRSFYDNTRLNRILDLLFRGAICPVPNMSRDFQLTALLIDPLDRWWSTGLHRDYRDFALNLDLEAWKRRNGDLSLFNQVNVPLLPDRSFWLIPGSHRREDTDEEARLVGMRSEFLQCRVRSMASDRVDGIQGTLSRGMERCRAVNLRAQPGDLIIYRSNMLHCGIYEPGVNRLTLHDGVYSAQWHEFVLETLSGPQPSRARRPD